MKDSRNGNDQGMLAAWKQGQDRPAKHRGVIGKHPRSMQTPIPAQRSVSHRDR